MERVGYRNSAKVGAESVVNRSNCEVKPVLQGLPYFKYYLDKEFEINDMYELCAVVHHISPPSLENNGVELVSNENTAVTGHFIATVKVGDNWILTDDEKVNIVDEKEVIDGTTSYILFYKKI